MDKLVPATNLGFPRIGPLRQLKRALEGYWAGRRSAGELQRDAAELRAQRWCRQRDLGIDPHSFE